jgi:hypothetical protein
LSIFPLLLGVGIFLPYAFAAVQSIALAVMCFKMPWEARDEYIETARETWPAIAALLLVSAVGGLSVSLFVFGAEMLILAATYTVLSVLMPVLVLSVSGALGFLSGRISDAMARKTDDALLEPELEFKLESEPAFEYSALSM